MAVEEWVKLASFVYNRDGQPCGKEFADRVDRPKS